jgi:tetratricopeptide (TPR) repeat protein
MPRKTTFRQLLVSILALWRDLSHKEIGAAAGIPQKRVSLYLRRGEIPEAVLDRLLAAIECSPAAVLIVTACLESLEALERENDLTAEEKAEIEDTVLRVGRVIRQGLAEATRLSRVHAAQGTPESHAVAFDRERAGELLGRLEEVAPEVRRAVVHVAEEYQSWALCERACQASVWEASRNVERAAAWAQLAQDIAARVPGPEDWRHRVQGYATAHMANVLRVSGNLELAESTLAEAKRLWQAGSDPAGVLDPGRLLDLEASLRRDQRRLPEALALLDEAAAVGRSPERALLKKGSTLEVVGQFQGALEALLQAVPIIQQKGDRRLEAILNCNLALNYCHLGRFLEAEELALRAGSLAAELGDELGVLRVTWTQGRIAAGLGRAAEARSLLAQARRGFAAQGMDYDVALALLEEAALLLDEGRAAEVKALARGLAVVFESKGVRPEALAALRVFQKAAEQENATAELARRVLGYLFRARHEPGLRFES